MQGISRKLDPDDALIKRKIAMYRIINDIMKPRMIPPQCLREQKGAPLMNESKL